MTVKSIQTILFETVEEMDSFEDEPMSVMADEGEEWDMEPVEDYEDDTLEACLKNI